MSTRRELEERERAIEAELDRRKTPSQRQAEAAIRGDRRRVVDDVHEDAVDEEPQRFWGDGPETRTTSERQAARATRGSSHA